jgi:hypothetical protein
MRLPGSVTLLLALVLALAAGCAPGSTDYTGPADECGPIEPSQEDVRFSLEFGQDLFDQPNWVTSYTVEPYRVTLTRRNDEEGAVAYLEYLMYNCGYGQAELNEYFSDEGFDIVFANYESYGRFNFCEEGNLALYEYALRNEGETYAARYWVHQITETRLLVFMLVFPEKRMFVMNSYAKELFPELVSCGSSSTP